MSAYSDRIVADGASSYWRLNDPSGTTAVATVGGANGTISGGVTLNQPGATSDGDKAMTFTGANQWIRVAAGVPAVGIGPFTIECWMKSTQVFVTATPFLLDTGGGANGVGVAILRTNTALIGFKIANGTGAFIITQPCGFDGSWHHIVAVMTRGTTDTCTLYVDGAPGGSNPSPVTGVNLTSALPLQFSTYSGGDSDPDFRFNGSLDEVAIYPVALTPAQIAAHYVAATSGARPISWGLYTSSFAA